MILKNVKILFLYLISYTILLEIISYIICFIFYDKISYKYIIFTNFIYTIPMAIALSFLSTLFSIFFNKKHIGILIYILIYTSCPIIAFFILKISIVLICNTRLDHILSEFSNELDGYYSLIMEYFLLLIFAIIPATKIARAIARRFYPVPSAAGPESPGE